MNIERDADIAFHREGTLKAVTQWIASHPEGIAEWLKNARRQYQIDRANVALEHRVAVLLLRDQRDGEPARIGVLDVGGATLEDVTAWGVWQDPEASSRGAAVEEEETQGNGGKAYMYRLFGGATRILGVREGHRNCRGFDGDAETVERGIPGWIPSLVAGRDVEISSFAAELKAALLPYGVEFECLPQEVRSAIQAREAFTLVEGENPTGLYKGKIQTEDLVAKVVRHDQATLCLEQLDIFVLHNGRAVGEGGPLRLPPITPYADLDSPIVHEVPAMLPLDGGDMVSTTEGGQRERGRLTLHTSSENMQAAYKNLRPRWQINYRTRFQMIGSKPVSEIAPATPSAQYVYGTVELPALEPAYVEHGRRRPKPGPLVEALDRFICQRVRDVARQIASRRQQQLDQTALDEVHAENQRLNDFKNQFLPSSGDGNGGSGTEGTGPRKRKGGGGAVAWGTELETLDVSPPEGGINVGRGMTVDLRGLLGVAVRDSEGLPVRASLEWSTSDHHVAAVTKDGTLTAREKGPCVLQVVASSRGNKLVSDPIDVRVWNVDHVLLTPRVLEIRLGTRQQIVAEVTDDDGERSAEVLLDWRHDADDQLIVRVSRTGLVTGNRVGRTAITAGAGGVRARMPVEVSVVPNPEKLGQGSGFPKLLLTDRDLDPETGEIREGDPDQPPLWQEPVDYLHNVWWLNVQSPEAAFAFSHHASNQMLWRAYHAQKLIDMVVQVWMTEDFTRKGESQQRDYWANHLVAMDMHRVRVSQDMWKRLQPFVSGMGSVDDMQEELDQ